MTMQRRFLVGLAGLLLLLVAAVTGYHALMGWSWQQSVFFTFITITTIGYNDYQLTEPAQQFTIVVIVVGLVCWTLMLYSAAEYLSARLEAERRRRMEREIEILKQHFVVVGYGPVGCEVAHALRQAGRRVVVVDIDPEAVEQAREKEYPAMQGDATSEETLIKAGIRRAAGLLAVTRNDPVNVFVTLTARGLCPDLFIAGNAIQSGVADKLRRAGATVVISPYELGAQRLAMSAVSPHVAELFATHPESDGLTIREAELEPGSELVGKTLAESALRQRAEVMVAAIKLVDGQTVLNPPANHLMQPGEILIAFGRAAQMPVFLKLVSPAAAKELAVLEP